MRIAIGNDHRGYRVKDKLIRVLGQLGHEVEDDGSHDSGAVDYPDVASVVCGKVASGHADRGIRRFRSLFRLRQDRRGIY